MNDGAFLSKMLATQLDRLDLISDIPVLDVGGKDIALKSYEIELKDVTFAYDSRSILDGINLKIPQNSTCAIVGPSGSGKTTLCNIIARFWDVKSGSVKIGGHDVREFTCDSLLSYVSMVFQKVYLFNDTIENNIKFGKPNASHAEVVAAAKRACCHDFIEALPQGYETMIGEAGSTLSGGEKQRISIARAILKDAPIIILDEATSSVDPVSYTHLDVYKRQIAAIAAGGWVAVLVIIVICLIGMIIGSCFGIFFSGEDSGTGQTMQTAVQELSLIHISSALCFWSRYSRASIAPEKRKRAAQKAAPAIIRLVFTLSLIFFTLLVLIALALCWLPAGAVRPGPLSVPAAPILRMISHCLLFQPAGPRRAPSRKRSCRRTETGPAAWQARLCRPPAPVSYTHLDVYKRQA